MTPVQHVTPECGHYELDVSLLMSKVQQGVDFLLFSTYHPVCGVELHELDAAEVVRELLKADPKEVDWDRIRLFNIPVIRDGSENRRRGVARLLQCENRHGARWEDCTFSSVSKRRFVVRDEVLTWPTMPTLPPGM